MTVKNKIYKHTNGLPNAVIFMVLFCMTFSAFQVSLERAFERFVPDRYYFEYTQGDEVRHRGNLEFSSSAVFRRGVHVVWKDSLFCKDAQGHKEKLPTQVWEDYQNPAVFTHEDEDFWRYREGIPEPGTVSCQLCGTIAARTPLGYPKTQSYCTDWFAYEGGNNGDNKQDR